MTDWDRENAEWSQGILPKYALPEDAQSPYSDWAGERPDPSDCMPVWTPEEATHYMMYEDTTEGTPISPAFPTPEELAQWLTDTGAPIFGPLTAHYERWLEICNGDDSLGLILTVEDGRIVGESA